MAPPPAPLGEKSIYDGFFRCNCMSPGVFGGAINQWFPPFVPVYYTVFGPEDIPQGPPQLQLPFNRNLVVTIVGLMFFNVAGMIWAKFRVHRRATLRSRKIAAKRKACHDRAASAATHISTPTRDAIEAQGLDKSKAGGMANLMNWNALLQKASAMPTESIQERVPIAALVESHRATAAVVMAEAPKEKTPRPETPPANANVDKFAILHKIEAAKGQSSLNLSPGARLSNVSPGMDAAMDAGPVGASTEYPAPPPEPGMPGGGMPPRSPTRLQRLLDQQGLPPPSAPFLVQQRVPCFSSTANSMSAQPFRSVRRLPPLPYIPSAPPSLEAQHLRWQSEQRGQLGPSSPYVEPYLAAAQPAGFQRPSPPHRPPPVHAGDEDDVPASPPKRAQSAEARSSSPPPRAGQMRHLLQELAQAEAKEATENESSAEAAGAPGSEVEDGAGASRGGTPPFDDDESRRGFQQNRIPVRVEPPNRSPDGNWHKKTPQWRRGSAAAPGAAEKFYEGATDAAEAWPSSSSAAPIPSAEARTNFRAMGSKAAGKQPVVPPQLQQGAKPTWQTTQMQPTPKHALSQGEIGQDEVESAILAKMGATPYNPAVPTPKSPEKSPDVSPDGRRPRGCNMSMPQHIPFRKMTPPQLQRTPERMSDWKSRRLGALMAEKDQEAVTKTSSEQQSGEDSPGWFLRSQGGDAGMTEPSPVKGLDTPVRKLQGGGSISIRADGVAGGGAGTAVAILGRMANVDTTAKPHEKVKTDEITAHDLTPARLATRIRVRPNQEEPLPACTPADMAKRARGMLGMKKPVPAAGAVSAAILASGAFGGTGPPKAGGGLAKWKGAGAKMKMAAAVKPPPPPPPPPGLWDIMKNNHTLVAAVVSPPPGDQQGTALVDTQLMQVFFNTLFLQLMVVNLFSARFTDYESELSVLQWMAAGTLAAFLVGWGTIACKLIFRWGNLQRRRTRFKQPPRIVEFYRWVKKELKGEETLFHGLQTLWYEYRTKEKKRGPKKAVKPWWKKVRGYTAWAFNIATAVVAVVLCIGFGIHFNDEKWITTMYGWAIAAGENFLLVEPIIILVAFATPRLIDRVMLQMEPTQKDHRGKALRFTVAPKFKGGPLKRKSKDKAGDPTMNAEKEKIAAMKVQIKGGRASTKYQVDSPAGGAAAPKPQSLLERIKAQQAVENMA